MEEVKKQGMESLFVPYEIALALKQLGFDKKEIEKVVGKLPKELMTIEEKLEWCLSKI